MESKRERRIAVIGLDGATLDLIERWVKEDYLPNFKKILEGGVRGRLESVVPPYSAPAWSTLYTGKNIGKHGLADFIQLLPHSYDIVPTSFSDNHAQTFWEIASSFNKRCVILNTPLTYPPREVNGILVSGLQTPPQAEDFTYPRSIRQQLEDLTGRYQIYPMEFDGERDDYLRSLYEITEKKFKAFLHYFKQNDWDLFMCVVQGTDLIQHYFWQFMDSAHPYYKENNRFKDAIREYYQKIDAYLGQFMECMDGKTTLIVLSDHGFSALHKYFYINNWLYKLGFIKFKQNPKAWYKKVCFALNFTPHDLYNFLFARKYKNKKMKYFFSFRDIDWAKTRAFSFTNCGQIFINLKGRLPSGCVQPGKEYEQICNEIVSRLYEIKDPETQERVLEKVYKRDEIYFGKYTPNLPDIFYLPNQGRYVNRGGNKFLSNKLIENCSPEEIGGSHSLYGIALFYGNGIAPGENEIEEMRIQDIAPTILAILGLQIPEDMDGKTKKELFQPGFVDVKYAPFGEEAKRREHQYSKDETLAIERRLKDLGYID